MGGLRAQNDGKYTVIKPPDDDDPRKEPNRAQVGFTFGHTHRASIFVYISLDILSVLQCLCVAVAVAEAEAVAEAQTCVCVCGRESVKACG